MSQDLEACSDDELRKFESDGAASLPTPDEQGYVDNEGARVWYAAYGTGSPVVLLHGGLGHGGNWSYQVPALVANSYRAVLIDSRGHGRSTRDARPYTYELMGSDVLAVMDRLQIRSARLVGWSDGACTSLILAATAPVRVTGVFFFACNMDPHGVKSPIDPSPLLERCLSRHKQDYARLSPTPDRFKALMDDLGVMQKIQPNYSAQDLARINVPVTVVQGEHDEFIKREHAEYLAQTIPNARLRILQGVSHFAPLQRPAEFNAAILSFIESL